MQTILIYMAFRYARLVYIDTSFNTRLLKQLCLHNGAFFFYKHLWFKTVAVFI